MIRRQELSSAAVALGGPHRLAVAQAARMRSRQIERVLSEKGRGSVISLRLCFSKAQSCSLSLSRSLSLSLPISLIALHVRLIDNI